VRVLLLSAYEAFSHRQWRETLQRGLADWEWFSLTLPPRHFSWRIRGNPLQWSIAERETLERDYDLVLATSMVDLATLRGLVPSLASVPTLLYFHENQFAYPEGRHRHGLLEAQMVSIYSALAADGLVFNSAFNRDSFLYGCAALLQGMPDAVPPGIGEVLAAKSRVLPVPVEIPDFDARSTPGGALQLIWNHRWEYDKNPDQLLEIATLLLDEDKEFTLHVVGQQFREQPDAFVPLKERLELGGALGHWGYIEDRRDYFSLLASCDVALSTSLHDFQGLSMLEACACGCAPLVPDRLVYPEWFAAEFRYRDSAAAVAVLRDWCSRKALEQALPVADVDAFSPRLLLEDYRALMRSQAQRNSVS